MDRPPNTIGSFTEHFAISFGRPRHAQVVELASGHLESPLEIGAPIGDTAHGLVGRGQLRRELGDENAAHTLIQIRVPREKNLEDRYGM